MESIIEVYERYKWFYTSSGKLVVAGKSASQNDELLKRVKMIRKDCYIMHTSEPGSPFSVIIADIEEISEKDLEECAIFTACFSRAWKMGKKRARIDIFRSASLFKSKNMKIGTWGVREKIKSKEVELELVLTRQKGVLRAVPESAADKILFKLRPGKVDKKDMLPKFHIELDEQLNANELLAALPAGGVKIVK